jgi:general secretion pathway protein F
VSKADLINDLRKSGHIILNIQQADKNKKFGFFLNRSNKKAVLPFTLELATLLEGGIPIDKSLSILLSGQDNNTIKDVIEDLLNGVKSGKSFAEALVNHVKLFSSVYINMVRAGEEGGVLPQVLKRLGSFQERLQKVRNEIISAMIYPLLLSCTGLVCVGALIVYVIPKFSQIFEGMGISLPFSTMILMGMSQYSIRYGWILIIASAVAFFLYKRAMKDKNTSIKIDQKKLKLPLIGNLLWKMQIARFARTLGTLLENGVPLLKSMDIVKDVLSNHYLADILGNVKVNVKEGAGLTVSLAKRGFLPEIAVHLLKVGEETGNLDQMLLKVADNFDAEVEHRMKRLVTMVEPVLILLMGAVIGVIVISMLTAILSVNDLRF